MQFSSLERESRWVSPSGGTEDRVKRKCNLVLLLTQLLKHLMSSVSKEIYAELTVLERHKIPLGNLWVN